MTITYYGKNVEVTQALREYLAGKFDALERFAPSLAEIHVTLEVNRHHRHGDVCTLHVLLKFPEQSFTIEESAADFYTCTDEASERIRRQVTKREGRRRTRDRRFRSLLSPKNIFLVGGTKIRSFGKKRQRQIRSLLDKIWRM